MSTEPLAPEEPVAMLIASQLDMILPPECGPGVSANRAILAGHWASLRVACDPDDARA